MSDRGLLGVCYYPEQWPPELWAEDARRMVDIGIRQVRIGEFAWSRIEPMPGEFHWDWLDDALAVLGSVGLNVVLCTPTAAPPKWLVDRHPDILPWDREGRPRRFGSRRHTDFSSPGWLQQTRRICTRIAERYGQHPAVVGWQLDNEYGCHDTVLSYSPAAATGFRDWLRSRYGTVQALNAAWGASFWSQEYRHFEEVDPPNLTVTTPNPSHELDFRRFASDAVLAYNRLQAQIVRTHSPGRFIAHNFMGFFTGFDHHALARELDVVAWDSYPLGFTNQRMNLSAEDRARFARTGHPDAAAFNHDFYRGVAMLSRSAGDSGQPRWWVMEQQPGPVNWADHNPAPADGMVRLWTWEAFAHGAETVSYFRWRQAPFAQEQMHAGLNRPDYAEDRAGTEAAQVAAERPALALGAPPPARVALVFDHEASWVFEVQPHGRSMRYQDLVLAFYTGLRQLGLDVDIVRAGLPLDSYRLVVVPSLPIVTDAALAAFQGTDATLLFGPRTGSRTQSMHHPANLAPGPLQALLPLRVARVESLPEGMPDSVIWNGRSYPVTRWRELLETALEPSARFVDDGEPAIVAEGRAHYLGFWPDPALLAGYLGFLCRQRDLPTVTLGETMRMRRCGPLRFAFNHGQAPAEAPAPPEAQFVLGERMIAGPGLAAWLDE